MQHLIFTLTLMLFSALHMPSVCAQDTLQKGANIIEIGSGLFVETVPAVYITEEVGCPEKLSEQWVVIPPVFETISETIIIQEAYSSLDIKPPVYNINGSTETAAVATKVDMPAITRELTRRSLKLHREYVRG